MTTYDVDALYDWSPSGTTVKIAGEEVPACSDISWAPPEENRAGDVSARGKRRKAARGELSLPSGAKVPIGPNRKSPALFHRRAAWVAVKPEDSDTGGYDFVSVSAVRKSAVAATACLGAAALLAWALLAPPASPASPSFLGGQVASGASASPHSEVSYATYQSTPDTVWKAGSAEQDIVAGGGPRHHRARRVRRPRAPEGQGPRGGRAALRAAPLRQQEMLPPGRGPLGRNRDPA